MTYDEASGLVGRKVEGVLVTHLHAEQGVEGPLWLENQYHDLLDVTTVSLDALQTSLQP